MQITLVCWSCGKETFAEIDHPIQFSFELAEIANKLGFKGIIDLNNSRSLVFCSSECVKKQTKKDGTIRLRPIKVDRSAVPPSTEVMVEKR